MGYDWIVQGMVLVIITPLTWWLLTDDEPKRRRG